MIGWINWSNDNEFSNSKYIENLNLGVYLVRIGIVNKNSNTLVYSYMYYPDLFLKTLLVYIAFRYENINEIYKEYGDNLVVIDKAFYPNDNPINLFMDERTKNIFYNMKENNWNMDEILDFTNRLMVIANYDKMWLLLDLAYNKCYIELMKEILNSEPYYYNMIELVFNKFREEITFNMVNKCLFVVSDLNLFIKGIRNKGYNISEGPQKWRGQISYINNFLSYLDMDYRNSLYNHNRFHVNIGTIDPMYYLPRNKFSFKNIHMDLGNVRW